ncbi:MAG: TetR/AcrR family transcriptional regulator [Candidatus Methanomethylophilaceae archaeon]
MKTKDTKGLLIDTTMALLRDAEDVNDVTVRDIIGAAGVNLSTINYHFGSKEELMKVVLLKLIEEKAKGLLSTYDDVSSTADPKMVLLDYLINMSDVVFAARKYTRAIIPSVMLNDSMTTPEYIVPMISECFEGKRTIQECRLIAFEIILFLQMSFYRMDDFYAYTGLDLNEKDVRSKVISDQLDMFIREENQ